MKKLNDRDQSISCCVVSKEMESTPEVEKDYLRFFPNKGCNSGKLQERR